jgi:N-acetylglutamate synthase-like GNAT family acetyltransferase
VTASPSPSLSPAIRRARPADAHRIASLIEQYVASGTLLPRTPEFIAERAIDFVVATLEGQVVGCAHLEEYSPSLAELRSLAVDPGYHRQGIGSALVKAVETLARSREYLALFAVSNDEAYFTERGYERREIPELDRERSEVSKFKGVYAKDLR